MTQYAVTPLAQEFSNQDEARWRALAEKALAGAPWERLVGRTGDGLALAPLYRETDFASAEDASGAPGASPFVRGAMGRLDPALPWHVRQIVETGDAAAANAIILDDLLKGVSSVELPAGLDLNTALAGVLLDIAPIALKGAAVGDADRLAALLPKGAAPPAFNLDPIGAAMRSGEYAATETAVGETAAWTVALGERFCCGAALRVDGRPVHEAGGSEAQELGAALASGLAYLRALETGGLDVVRSAPRLLFTLCVGPDVLVETAKLRALRLAWAKLTEACGRAMPARIHAVTSRRMMTRYDPWTNILRTTAATFAAACGGAEAITTLPLTDALGAPDAFGRRIARNTQIILMEESRLGHVIDPAGGAWFVEKLTRELAEAAWSQFQTIERTGGILAALEAGTLQAEVAQARATRAGAFAKRREAATGVTDFPLLGERTPSFTPRPPSPEPLPGALVPIRWAEPFETLRDRAERSSARPGVFFANLGPLAKFSARSNFTANLLAAGGIAAHGPETVYRDLDALVAAFRASRLAAASFCGDDPTYATDAESAAAALKTAGASWVILAGRPGEAEDRLRAAGVDQFVFAGQDALDALATLHAALGIDP